MVLDIAEWKRIATQYGWEVFDNDVKTIVDALEAAQPIVNRIGRFGLPFLTDNDCNCEMCVQDRAVQAAFAEIDFSGLIPESTRPTTS